jgi:hypothetical protein
MHHNLWPVCAWALHPSGPLAPVVGGWLVNWLLHIVPPRHDHNDDLDGVLSRAMR